MQSLESSQEPQNGQNVSTRSKITTKSPFPPIQASKLPSLSKSSRSLIYDYFEISRDNGPPATLEFLLVSNNLEDAGALCNENALFDILNYDKKEWVAKLKRYAELARGTLFVKSEKQRLEDSYDKYSGAYALTDENLFERARIPPSQIIQSDWESTPQRPAFYIAIDDVTESIILGIRGTKSSDDLRTDFQWNCVEISPNLVEGISGAKAHEGMIKASLWFKQNCLGTLQFLASAYPTFNVRMVGHSLGGGVAALAGLFLKNDFPKLEVIAFAPPSCTNNKLAGVMETFVTSVFNQQDIIPLRWHRSIIGISSWWKGLRGISETMLSFPSKLWSKGNKQDNLITMSELEQELIDNRGSSNEIDAETADLPGETGFYYNSNTSGTNETSIESTLNENNAKKMDGKVESSQILSGSSSVESNEATISIENANLNSTVKTQIDCNMAELTENELIPPGVYYHLFQSRIGTMHIRKASLDTLITLPVNRSMIAHHRSISYLESLSQIEMWDSSI